MGSTNEFALNPPSPWPTQIRLHTSMASGKPEGAQAPAILDANARIPEHVVYRSFVNETVALNLETGKYHGLNPTAGHMIEALERAANVRDAAAQLSTEYGRPLPEIEHDLATLCRELAERGLIQVTFDERRG